MIHQSIKTLVGQTPLYEPKKYARSLGVQLLTKLEFYNPAGSVKDRVALYIIEDAEKQGKLKEGGVIIEPTSGNTGIGIAFICQKMGYKSIIVMPEGATRERIALIESYGGQVVLSKKELGIKGSIALAEEIKNKTVNSVILSQFKNPANVLSHEKTTAKEIDSYFKGDIDVVVAGVGTGGTVTGLGRYFKKQSKNKIIIGATASTSAILNGGVGKSHRIFGIGSNIIPPILDKTVIDMILPVTEEEAYSAVKELYTLYGLKLGVSTGATYFIAKKASLVYPKKRIVFISADGEDRYESLNLYS